MNIGILTSTDLTLLKVKADGSSDAQAQQIDDTAVAAPRPRPVVNVAPSITFPSMRAALDAQIAADVRSGTLSGKDAATVAKTLDAIDTRSTTSASTPAAAQAYFATLARGTLVDRFG